MVAIAVMGAATPVAALLGDRFGRRTLSLAGCAAMAVCVLPYLAVLRTAEPVPLLAASTVTLLALIATIGVQGAYIPELFDAWLRCTGTAVAYNLGAVLGGALTPLVATRLAGGGSGSGTRGVALCLLALCALSLGCFAALPDTRAAAGAAAGAPAAEPGGAAGAAGGANTGQPGRMEDETQRRQPPVVVDPPLDGRRRVMINGADVGAAVSADELRGMLRRADLAGEDVNLDDPGLIEWRGGGPDDWPAT
jgi:MFS family permease